MVTQSGTRLVHVVPDEKFVDIAWREFERAHPGGNLFLIVGKPRALQYVREADVRFCRLRDAGRLMAEAGCRAVVLHSLLQPRVLYAVPPGKPSLWIGWGFDYYERLLARAYPDGLLLDGTRALVDAHERSLRRAPLRGAVSTKRRAVRTFDRLRGRSERRALAALDYFAPVLDTEFELARQHNPWFTPQFAAWNYGTVEDDLDPAGDAPALGEAVLVGNSADPVNNHLDAFDLLAATDCLHGRKIVVPLSYGKDWYRDAVIEAGRRRFGDRFVPLTEFLAPDAFGDILRDCGYVVMNQLRQHAMATICMAMLNGSRLFLRQRNPAYAWFRARHCAIDDLETLGAEAFSAALTVPLTAEQRQANATAVRSHWSRAVQRERTRQLIDRLLAGAGGGAA